jgi:uncharacterized protein (TIGR02117 family)
MLPGRMHRRRITIVLASSSAIILAYPLAGLAGGAITSNSNWSAPAQGVTIFIESNGVHTGIVMPKQAAGVDWRGVFPGGDIADPRYAAHDHISVGWGERDFYLHTPTWADLKLSTVVAAAVGREDTLVHVDHVPRPPPGGELRRLTVRPAEYRRLAAYIQASLVRGGPRHRGYFGYDVFYTARGRYSAIRTCNAWIGDALRFAGIQTGAWTPFPVTVQWWYPRYQ